MSSKLTNCIPPLGGATCFTGIFLEFMPDIGSMVQTVILATIGAVVGGVVGYMVKRVLDRMYKK